MTQFFKQPAAFQEVSTTVVTLSSIIVAGTEDKSDMQWEGHLEAALLAVPQSPDQLANMLVAHPTHLLPIQKDLFLMNSFLMKNSGRVSGSSQDIWSFIAAKTARIGQSLQCIEL